MVGVEVNGGQWWGQMVGIGVNGGGEVNGGRWMVRVDDGGGKLWRVRWRLMVEGEGNGGGWGFMVEGGG